MSLRAVGFWFDDRMPSELPRPQALVDDAWTEGERAVVADYLRRGIEYETDRGVSCCRFGCGDNGHRELTDGTWIWPEGLAHYVMEHSVRLPDDVIARALAGKPPKPMCIQEVDYDEWVRWGRSRGATVPLAAPWARVEDWRERGALVEELQRELAPGHVLEGASVEAVARRVDCDDVLFVLVETLELAVVHLTWSRERERDPVWPWTMKLAGWHEWRRFFEEDTA